MANILVIDDETSMRHMIRDVLETQGHTIEVASNGEEGYNRYDENKNYDLVITDLVMPVCTGLDLIAKLREKDPELPIIAISGGGGITGRFDYLPIAGLIGATVILHKPFHVHELRQKVTEVLEP